VFDMFVACNFGCSLALRAYNILQYLDGQYCQSGVHDIHFHNNMNCFVEIK